MKLKVIESKVKDKIFNMGTDLVRGNPKDELDSVEIVILGDKVNEHYTEWFDSKCDYYFEVDGVEYKITKDSILKMRKSFVEQFRSKFWIPKIKRFRKLSEKFVIFFDKGVSEPKIFDFTEPKVNSKIVYIAINSGVTKRGIASLFKEGFGFNFNLKTLLMVAVSASVLLVVVYGYTQGWFSTLLKW